MFTSRGLFSNIECPYSGSCVLPKCLFLHPEAATTKSKIPDPEEAQPIIPKSITLPESKVVLQTLPKIPVVEALAKDKKVAAAGHSGGSQSSEALPSVRRRISPPPLGRGTSNDSSTPSKQEPEVPKPKPKTPAEKVLKVEALNPRMLKQSPASHDLRYRLLKALHDQLLRLNNELRKDASASEEVLVLSDQALITMALDLEEKAAVAKAAIYSNVVKNHILVYKRMSVKDWKEACVKIHAQEEALKAINTPKPANTGPPKSIDTGLSKKEELAFLPRLYTPIQGLEKHGYVSKVPSKEDIEQAKMGVEAAKGWEVCDRCKARFQVFPGRREEDGALTSGGTCKYHWGKPYWQDKVASDPKAKREKKYRCCGQSMGDSVGCTKGDSHVFKISEVKRLAAVFNFEETPENDDGSKEAVCIDGEMGYTVYGLELIRLTATAWPCRGELLDVLVRPVGEVLDLNSRFSGVWPQQMADAVLWTPGVDSPSALHQPDQNGSAQTRLRIVDSPAAARSLLCQHLSPQTPLIGHGLENDLNAVRLIHPTLIDTALLFPHQAGLPYRNGLKSLMFNLLNRHIQVVVDGKMDGHDSKEDARAAGDLVRLKISKEWQRMKREGWNMEDGKFIPPLGPKTKLTVEYLERELGTKKPEQRNISGTKRPLEEISRDNVEEGELDDG
jgi:RNA exonuclease 1